MPPIPSTTSLPVKNDLSERMEEDKTEEPSGTGCGEPAACLVPSSSETMNWCETQTEEALIADEFSKLNAIYQAQLDQLVQQGIMLFSSATLRHNYHKNRYSNILAMEPTRVKLQGYRDFYLDTDYINANYINGEIPGSERAYISCQAPLPNTLLHFWLMIWENNSSVIVMLTRLVERDRPKAIIYWPEEVGDSKRFGSIVVTYKKTKTINPYLEMRTLEVERDGTKRQIVQFHYTEWPDFGIPNSTQTIRELVCWMDLYRMKGATAGLNGPVITHCSAGVGRTGTFIAVHICLEKMKFFNTLEQINIPRTVLLLRQSRNGMVQTPEQYQFIYEVLKDARADLREKQPRVFASPCSLSSSSPSCSSPSASLSCSSSETETKMSDRSSRNLTGLKRSFKELQIVPIVMKTSPCSSETMMDDSGRKEKTFTSLEKKRRLSFSTC